MQPDDAGPTILRPRPDGAVSRAGDAEPADLEADTMIRAPSSAPTPAPMTGIRVGPTPAVRVDPAAPVEPPALVEPPRGHPAMIERPVAPRAGLPTDPAGLRVPWYGIRVNRHAPIPLDVPALIGRRPVPPRVALGGQPRLVRVPSPGREVSATHLELRQHGASVIVTDLRSTNGTIVSIPGSSSLKLRQGESFVVSAGTVVDIGDGNTIEILPIERLV
ncbi:MAG: FHA domain-containing protein [Actinomycetota bacterium]